MPFCGASERCSFSSTLKIYYLLLIRNHRMRFGLALLLASSPLATVVIDFSSYWFGGMRTDQLHSFRRSTILPSESSIPLSKKFVLRSACGWHCLWEPTSATHTHRHSTGDWKHDFVSCADPNAQFQPTAQNSNQHFHAFLLSKVWSNICFLKLHQHLGSHSIATTRISTMMDPPHFFFTEQQFSNNDDITAMFLVRLIMHQQAEKQQCPRMNWEDQAALKEPVNAFSWHCHMTVRSFEKLVRILSPILKEDERQQAIAGCAIPLKLATGMGLRFLGGLAPKDAASKFGVSISVAHQKIKPFVQAVNKSFTIDVPWSAKELERCAAVWNEKSGAFGMFHGCVGVINGWLSCIHKPKNADNTVHCHGGYYQQHGVNVQALVDANLRFICFGAIGPGRTNDARAFYNCIQLRQVDW